MNVTIPVVADAAAPTVPVIDQLDGKAGEVVIEENKQFVAIGTEDAVEFHIRKFKLTQ
jgi:hypothetical protein